MNHSKQLSAIHLPIYWEKSISEEEATEDTLFLLRLLTSLSTLSTLIHYYV